MPSSFAIRPGAILLVHVLIFAPLARSQKPGSEKASAQASATQSTSPAQKLLIKDGTPVKMKLKRGVYSQYAKVGDEVDYLVDDELVVNGKIIVPEGALVKGKVVSAEHKRTMGRGGKIDISADSIKLFNSQSIPLRAFQQARGGGQGLDMSGEMLAAASLTLGVGAPFVLFKHGKDIEIRQGSSFTAFVNGDTWLEDIAFPAKSSSTVSDSARQVILVPKRSEDSPQNNQTAAVSITSAPAGAEIELDGNFVGNTPETLKVLPGDHLVVLHKHGYKNWERNLRIAGEIVNIAADLEHEMN